ncbi:MAG: OmpA family protein [Bacteroidaceae bacterium]|nr:OmpA family protein [Bacteroidaceae bacterium]
MRKFQIILTSLLLMLCGSGVASAQGFLKGLADKAKDKVKQKIEQKVENTVDNAADRVLNGKKSKKNNSEATETQETEEAAAPSVTTANVKSDFVPGSVVVFEDVVKGEQVGEFPSKWDLERGNAEIAVVNGEQAIELAKEDCWIKPLISKNPKNYFGDEFTVEFDIMYTEGSFEIDFMHPDEQRDSEIFTLTWGHNGALSLGYVRPDCANNHSKEGSSHQDQKTKLNDNRWHHYAISFNKRVIKVYVDNVRYINVPSAKAGAGWMTFFYRGENPAYLKNVRIARGAGELYGRNATDASEGAIAKAMEETGKFVTNNINFETAKATLLPESMTEIQKVADYMLKNKNVRFEVQGHCDNQGSDKVNDPLSQQRAEAVVAALVKLGVDEWNLRAVGKGSHEPVADNATEEGRAKNRRVEFIKK